MRTFLVVNPSSANGDTGRRWPDISAAVGRAVGEIGSAFTTSPMHAAALTARALEEGWDCIVAVGGDGTLNEVVNGFFQARGGPPPGATLAVIPQGTGGDFRRTFGWPADLRAACERLRRAEIRPLDVGVVSFIGADGRAGRRHFVNVTSFGVSGQVDREVSRASKGLGGKLTFFLASMRAMWRYRDQPVRLRVDGGPWEELRITTVAAANCRYFGGGMCVAPEADPADGLLDVTVWSGYTLKDFILKSSDIYRGTHVRLPGTRTFRARVLEAESEEEVLLDVDGEQPGRLPARIEVLPGALRLRA
ncbi:MAG TPA: diacylglycerol kinase family protein [Myxococcaceae bacterium]|nr:diacylglycerol kinase family protein [Myxococcaceae bacterium]